MFEARISASYGKKQVLHDIRFCLPEGVTALLGRNGSGKSTLLHCIAGALPFEGSVKLDGKELKGLPARERAKLLSILPQMLPSPDLPAEEVVGFGRSPYSARLSAKEREEVAAAMQKLGIGELAKRRVSTLSGGEKQKVFLAMLLVQDTPLVLLDEPTTYMDLPFKSVFFSVLQELKEKKKDGALCVARPFGRHRIFRSCARPRRGRHPLCGEKGRMPEGLRPRAGVRRRAV